MAKPSGYQLQINSPTDNLVYFSELHLALESAGAVSRKRKSAPVRRMGQTVDCSQQIRSVRRKGVNEVI
jgi:hypothetical protein